MYDSYCTLFQGIQRLVQDICADDSDKDPDYVQPSNSGEVESDSVESVICCYLMT